MGSTTTFSLRGEISDHHQNGPPIVAMDPGPERVNWEVSSMATPIDEV